MLTFHPAGSSSIAVRSYRGDGTAGAVNRELLNEGNIALLRGAAGPDGIYWAYCSGVHGLRLHHTLSWLRAGCP